MYPDRHCAPGGEVARPVRQVAPTVPRGIQAAETLSSKGGTACGRRLSRPRGRVAAVIFEPAIKLSPAGDNFDLKSPSCAP